jgi:hypothetical protein
VRQDNAAAYGCLYQFDVNLTSPPLSVTCSDHSGTPQIDTHFANSPFAIEDYIPASATTCPAPGQFATNGILNGQGLPGGCTRDIVQRTSACSTSSPTQMTFTKENGPGFRRGQDGFERYSISRRRQTSTRRCPPEGC